MTLGPTLLLFNSYSVYFVKFCCWLIYGDEPTRNEQKTEQTGVKQQPGTPRGDKRVNKDLARR